MATEKARATDCGRVRRAIRPGWTPLVDSQLKTLGMAALSLQPGESYTLDAGDREYALVLVHGQVSFSLASGLTGEMGPRRDPFNDLPYGLLVSREERVTITAVRPTLIGAGSAPAAKHMPPALVTPAETRTGLRGVGNWERTVRMVCWSDNTVGNQLISGETITPSGNWSTMPPHRHQYDTPDTEVPYEEVYFFQFSRPQGYGLIWQFDDEGEMDQAFSLRQNDAAYMGHGYHPTACGPGTMLYHFTFIAGPYRLSKSSVHPDYKFLLDENDLENPYARQTTKG